MATQDLAQENDVIFEITKQHLETGMRGYPVGYCTTSSVDPKKGLFYGGKPVADLAKKEPMEVIFQLYYAREARGNELEQFQTELINRSTLDEKTVKGIRNLPVEGHPMKLFCSALMIAGMFEAKEDYREDCLNVIAKLPLIVAQLINHHAGFNECRASNPDLGYMENFTQMLNCPDVNEEELTKVLKLFNILHYDHGGGNLSTFVGKAVASSLADMYGSLSAAMAALAGPRHGKANQDCLEFVRFVYDKLGDKATSAQVEQLIRDRLKNKELIFGFGHAVLRVEDPRATVQYEIANEMYPNDALVKIASLLRENGVKVLSENEKIQNPNPNVDAISGTLLQAAGFNYPQYYTVLFGLSRCVGIAIQIVHERLVARGGKGTPIIRPKYFYRAP